MSERKAMDIMEKVFVTADPSTTVLDLIQLFIKNKITSIPIVNDDGTLAGIVTDADLLYKKIKPHKSFKKLMASTAKELMTKDVIIAAPDADVEQLAGVMVAEHLKVIPIVDNKRCVGVVTRRSILEEMHREYEEEKA